ncbi:hypothetical protein [Paenibacillus harenae]|uniref:Uncharacterized protein n=1 Tax=Paenibacillus harenae TaxID=306543 RepID=A0ABT9U5F0_PAEHA|nr:hypothetical protein [Paenibacillus harenae]MDQ0114296.1 hypothetical protein [Paenibacillus harenae]
MSDDNARFKQRLDMQQDENAPLLKDNSQEGPGKSEYKGGLQSENREWKRFYEAIRQITEDMRH